MTEVEIHGGPRDGETFDVAGNPERGELVAGLDGVYRVYERTDGTWVGVWTGYGGNGSEPEPAPELPEAKPAPTVLEIVTVAMFAGGLGAALAAGLLVFVALGWAAEWLAARAGGWTNLTFAAASAFFVFGAATGVAARIERK